MVVVRRAGSALGDDGTTGRWRRIRRRIIKRDRGVCQLCGFTAVKREDGSFRGLEVDHILPRSAGGTDHPDNLRTLCPKCHRGVSGRATADVVTYGPQRGGPGRWAGVPLHRCGTEELPSIRGSTNAPRWEGGGCPPNCPSAA